MGEVLRLRAQGCDGLNCVCAAGRYVDYATGMCAGIKKVRGVLKEGGVLSKGVCFLSIEFWVGLESFRVGDVYKLINEIGLG